MRNDEEIRWHLRCMAQAALNALAAQDKMEATVSRLAAVECELDEYRLRLAGALTALDGHPVDQSDEKMAPYLRSCPTIKTAVRIRRERDEVRESLAAAEAKLAEVARERDEIEANEKSQTATLRANWDHSNAVEARLREVVAAAEAREKAIRELLATWQRNRAATEYGTGAPGPLYVAGMAAEADAMIDGLRAVLAVPPAQGTPAEALGDEKARRVVEAWRAWKRTGRSVTEVRLESEVYAALDALAAGQAGKETDRG